MLKILTACFFPGALRGRDSVHCLKSRCSVSRIRSGMNSLFYIQGVALVAENYNIMRRTGKHTSTFSSASVDVAKDSTSVKLVEPDAWI